MRFPNLHEKRQFLRMRFEGWWKRHLIHQPQPGIFRLLSIRKLNHVDLKIKVMAQILCSLGTATFQNIIKGLSTYDAKCKTWCITLNVPLWRFAKSFQNSEQHFKMRWNLAYKHIQHNIYKYLMGDYGFSCPTHHYKLLPHPEDLF